MNEDAWNELKKTGSGHYKAASIEPIDLLRDLKPHPDLTALQVKALTDCIKYAYRQLTGGANISDCGKIVHYIEMVKLLASK